MVFVLARDPREAKTRLAPWLDGDARARLALAMLEDVIAATSAAGLAVTLVAPAGDAIREIATRSGIPTLDLPAAGTNAAARDAFRVAAQRAADAALAIASDLPLLTAEDLDALVDAGRRAAVVIAPDRHGRGTNALLLAPPLAIAPAFGTDSFAVHRRRAEDAGLPSSVVARRGLAHDVDEVADLRLLLRDPAVGPRTAACLATLDLRSAGTG